MSHEEMLFLRHTYHQALRAATFATRQAARLDDQRARLEDEGVEVVPGHKVHDAWEEAMDLAVDMKTVARQASHFYNRAVRRAKDVVYEDEAHPLVPEEVR